MGLKRFCVRLAAIGLVLSVSPLLLFAAEEIKNSACMDCHSDPTLSKTNATGKVISLFVDEAKLAASIHKTNTCVSCHSDLTSKHPDDGVAALAPNCARCHEKQSESFGASVHGVALANGNKDAAIAVIVTTAILFSHRPPRCPRSTFRIWPRRAGAVMLRRPVMWRRVCTERP